MPERGEEGVDGLVRGPAGKSLIETVRALEDGLRSGEAGAGEDDRGHPGMGRPARVQSLGPRSVGEVLDDPACLAAADAEGVDELVLGEVVEPARHRRRREACCERGGMEVARVEPAGHGEADPAHHFHARYGRLEDSPAGGARRFADGQGGGDSDASRVHDRTLARVVEVEAVGEGGVGEDRARRARLHLGADERAFRGPAQSLGAVQHGAAEVLARRGEAAPEGVEHEHGRLRGHPRGNVRAGQTEHEARIAPGHRRMGHVSSPVRSASRNTCAAAQEYHAVPLESMRAPAESMHAGANGTGFGITSAAGYSVVGEIG